ncbi:MAG: class I SAM-dependent methyltransferase [Armatimonadota bacterium]|nr:class I SAM-dependent methyltransferase [Armatimonadota bacterium]
MSGSREATGKRLSFRDPDGSLVELDGEVLRIVREGAAERVRTFLESPLFRGLVDEGLLVPTWPAQTEPPGQEPACGANAAGERPLVLRHETVEFPSYPHEWPAEMLWEAGRLTLELCERSLEFGFGLKDATPYNVLFRGPRPVFVDVLSFEPREPGDFVWTAYGQFVRTFLLPLALWRWARVPPAVVFSAYREGLAPEQAVRWLGTWARLRPPVLTLATLPHWLAGWADRMGERLHRRRIGDAEVAGHVLRRLFRGLRDQLERLQPPASRDSEWARYEEAIPPQARRAKHDWVVGTLRRLAPKTVLDLGCNTGSLAQAAAGTGARVVAVDRDPVVVGLAWRRAASVGCDVLPLVVDVARSTPALGWRNLECRSFLDRAQGRFDCVLMLALIHHLAVTEHIPVGEVAALTRDLTRRFALVEFVPQDDPMFCRLVRGRDTLFASWTQETFEAAFRQWFDIVDVAEIPGSARRLYCMVRRD